MKSWGKILSTTAVFSLATTVIVGCGSTASQQTTTDNGTPVDGGTLTMQLPSTPDTDFNPIVTNNMYTVFGAILFCHEQLFQENPDGTFSPNLAESYDISPDKKTVTIHMRKNAKWSDGQPITADDVAFTYNVEASKDYAETLQGPQDDSNIQGWDEVNKGSYDQVASGTLSMSGIKVIDPYTIQVTMKDAFANALTQVNNYVIPKHIWAKIPIAQWPIAEQNVKNDVASGPYVVSDYKSKEYITLTKNKYWYGNKAHIDTITWKVVTPDTAAGELKNGQLDEVTWVQPSDMRLYDTLSNLTKIDTPQWGYQYIGFKLNNPFLKDVALRQAIAYSIDRDAMIKGLLQGQGSTVNYPIPKSPAWYPTDNQIPPYTYDPAKAKQILKDAGYKLDAQGHWETPDGKPIVLSLSYPTGNQVRMKAAPMYVKYMQNIGLNVTLNPPTDFATLYKKVYANDPGISMYLFGSSFTRLDPDQTGSWGPNDANNLAHWINPESDKLIAEAISPAASDLKTRQPIQLKWDKLYHEQVPEFDVYGNNDVYYFTNKLHGVKNYKNVYDIFYHPENWWLSK